jgi:hypothetical protein
MTSWLEEGTSEFGTRLMLLFWYFRDLDMAGYLPLLLIIPIGSFLIFMRLKHKKTYLPRIYQEYVLVTLGYMLIVGLASPQAVSVKGVFEGLADIRYAVVVLPFAAVVVAGCLVILHKAYGAVAAGIITALLIATNIFSLNIAYNKFRWLLPAYIYEIHNDYTTSYEAAIDYLKTNAAQDDTVYAVPEFATTPMLFYLGDKLIIGGTRRKGTFDIQPSLAQLNYPVCVEDYYPQWIVSFAMNKQRQQIINFFARDRYAYTAQARLDVFWRDMTRPELPWHSFTKPKIVPNSNVGVFIFRRIEKNPPAKQPAKNAQGA